MDPRNTTNATDRTDDDRVPPRAPPSPGRSDPYIQNTFRPSASTLMNSKFTTITSHKSNRSVQRLKHSLRFKVNTSGFPDMGDTIARYSSGGRSGTGSWSTTTTGYTTGSGYSSSYSYGGRSSGTWSSTTHTTSVTYGPPLGPQLLRCWLALSNPYAREDGFR